MKKSWIGLTTITLLLACGEADQSDTSKTIPENGGQAGSGNQVYYLLRGDMADRLAADFIGYEMNDPVPCASVYSDVKNDTKRCSYMNILDSAGVKLAYPYDDGSVGIHPGEKVSWKELWQHTTEALGWIPYADECLKDYPLIQASQPYSGYAAALCARGLLNDKKPDDLVTLKEMSEWMIQTLLYQAGSCTRFDLIELMAAYYQDFSYDPNFVCQPLFPDVTSDMKLRCQLTEFMVKKGLIQGLPDGKFHGENQFNMAEFMKMLVFSSKLETSPCQTMLVMGRLPKIPGIAAMLMLCAKLVYCRAALTRQNRATWIATT